MRLMDFIQQPDVLKLLFGALGILTTLTAAYAYRAKKAVDIAHAQATRAVEEAQTAKTEAETAKLEAEARHDTLRGINALAEAIKANADNDRAERELRRQQIEQQNAAMMAIATNMNLFMQENKSGREAAVQAVVNPLQTEIEKNRIEIVHGFRNLETWLDAIADGIDETKQSLHRIIELVQQPPVVAAVAAEVTPPTP